VTCAHERFKAEVAVGRLTDGELGPVTAYVADVRVSCLDCGEPFCFRGLKAGYDAAGASVSVDGQEAHLALVPSSADAESFVAQVRGPLQ
jgi:hypothetical protein